MKKLGHGDVRLFREKMPKDGLIDEKTNIVQWGEVTNHAHRLTGGKATLYTHVPTKTRWLKVVEPVSLKHEEHHTIEIPPGEYRIGIVRETDHLEGVTRQVAD